MYRNRLLILAILAATGTAVWLALPAPRAVAPAVDQTDALLDGGVSAGSGLFDVELVTLDKAVAIISKAAGIPIAIDWPQLETAGYARGDRHPVQILYGWTLRNALHSVFQSYSPCANKNELYPPLRYSMRDGTLLVSIDRDARQLRVYDVRDLLTDGYWGTLPIPANASGFQTARMKDLCNYVACRLQTGIDWGVLPSGIVIPADRVDSINGRLLVTTTPANHRHVERILASLRRMNSHDAPDKLRLP
ncbi:MAG TPA: hypothetical protein VFE47_00170 [Tepidisphaeraceae bacterium]|jgi:hypothetical protein|nr:hypothetical protein [Tepidisphaeraceae bacterium]